MATFTKMGGGVVFCPECYKLYRANTGLPLYVGFLALLAVVLVIWAIWVVVG